MKNTVRYTTVYGKQRYAEFARIEKILTTRGAGGRYYNVYVTGVVYTDTGETGEKTVFGLFDDGDWIKYGGIRYEYRNGGLNRLCMVVENENNMRILDSL